MPAQAKTVRLSDTMGGLNSTERAGLANALFGGHGANSTSSEMQTQIQPLICEIEPRMKHGAAHPQPPPLLHPMEERDGERRSVSRWVDAANLAAARLVPGGQQAEEQTDAKGDTDRFVRVVAH